MTVAHHPKIHAHHLRRKALVYVRQSTLHQVFEHGESTARQYGLTATAQDLGWPDALVEVIDDDLGQSGASATRRPGFQRLVASVALGQVGTVTLVGQPTATQVQLHIRDTGRGIPAARLATMFEPLYTTKPGGTGLGLYIVQEIVAAHGGQVSVASVEGQGTTVTMTLPRPAAPYTSTLSLWQAGEGL